MTCAEAPMLTSLQVAEALNVTRRQVRHLSIQHEIGQKVGRDWVYTAADLEQLRAIRAEHGRQRRPREDG